MKILFLVKQKWPHVGGVEKHVDKIVNYFKTKGHWVNIISIENIDYLHVKYVGLFSIWLWLFKNRSVIKESDAVHCHDVFIWYLPFVFIYPSKKVFVTIHGWEESHPFSFMSVFQKQLALKLSTKSIGIGHFLQKYLNVKFDVVNYGAASKVRIIEKNKIKNKIVYVGRLEKNTGLLEFLDWLKTNSTSTKYNQKYTIDFCGDGPLRAECQKFGKVHGFVNPNKYYKKAEICIPGGYLAALEALSFGCKIKLFWNNKVKEDYWKMSPFYKLKGDKLKAWARQQTWEKLADQYLSLYKF